MVAKITTGSNIYGALAYNQEKVDGEKGTVLATHILREPVDGNFDVAYTANELMRWMPSVIRTEKPVIHISLNPDPKDTLTDGQLSEIAEKYMERMGWGGQPYIVFKHSDIEREHIHIVSVQVGRDGRKIKDGKRNEGGRITGATFIDHENRSVFNGSRLGKEYSANALQERFGTGLVSGAGSIGRKPDSHEEIRPTPPAIPVAPETQQIRPARRRTVVKKKKPKMGI